MADLFGDLMIAAWHARHYLEEQKIAGMIVDLRAAAIGAELGALAAGAIPVAAMAGVWAALGSGYLGAEQYVKKEKFAQGYSRGFIMGLLGWQWEHAINRFGVHGILHTNHFDERLDKVGATEYMRSMAMGFRVSNGFTEGYKKSYLRGLKTFSSPDKRNWTRNDQISYVIELSTAYRKHFMRL